MAPYKDLLAWKECHQLVLDVYQATKSFPKHELYGLTSQVRRAAFSAAANIVEGSWRKGPREFRRFLDISVASLSEVEYALEVAKALEYLAPDAYGSCTHRSATRSEHDARRLAPPSAVLRRLFLRTGRDSNPRYPYGHTGFRDRRLQPLGHLSKRLDVETPRTDRVGFEPTKRFPVYTLSKRAPSATRPPILNAGRKLAAGPASINRARALSYGRSVP